jgi:hypothetical protein
MIPWERSSRRGKRARVVEGSDHQRRRFFGERRWEEKEEERKKKPRPNWYRRQGVSLVDTLPCLKGVSEGGALRAYVVRFPLLAGLLGRHYPWRPTMHLRRQDGCHYVLKFRYKKSICEKMFFKRVKKLHTAHHRPSRSITVTTTEQITHMDYVFLPLNCNGRTLLLSIKKTNQPRNHVGRRSTVHI